MGMGDQTRVVQADQAAEDPIALSMIAPGHKFPVPTGVSKTPSLPSAGALGKGFIECRTRQRSLGKDFIGKNFFAECQKSTLSKVLAECQVRTRQKNNCRQHLTPSLPSAQGLALGKI
jgi:hypothetical protein